MVLILHPHYQLKEIRIHCREYFENALLTLTEILFLSNRLNKEMDRIFDIEGRENIDMALKSGKGAILFSSHTGNFFYYYYYLSQHYPSLVVATAMDEDLHQLYLIFHRLGCNGLDYDTTNKKEMLRIIKEHLDNNGILVLFGDFWRSHFPESTMFNKITRSPRGTAGLALDFAVPVIPFYGHRVKGLQHKIVIREPINLHELYSRNEKKAATDFLNRLLEKNIVQEPAQWFYWFNADERWEKA
jgi:KDO2-lipid IV(A) lauroyltransferase